MSTKKAAAKKAAKTEAPAAKPAATPKPAPAPKVVKEIPTNKVAKASLPILAFLHSTAKLHTLEEIAAAVDSKPGLVTKAVTPLIEELMVEKVEKATTTKFRFVGQRVTRLGDLVNLLSAEKKPMTAAEVGKALWADPKKPQANDDTRFMAAASAALKNAFDIGAIGRNRADGTTVGYFAL